MVAQRSHGGFTLLEVAIALAIISLVFVSLITLFNSSMAMTDYSKKLTSATFLAQELLTEMELKNDYKLGESDEIELKDEYENYSYKVEVKETPIPFVQELNLTLFFDSAIKKHSLQVTTFIIMEAPEEEPQPQKKGT